MEDYSIQTPIGSVDIAALDGTRIRATAGGPGSSSPGGVVLHGVAYQLRLFVAKLSDSGWEPREGWRGGWAESIFRWDAQGGIHGCPPSNAAVDQLQKVLRPAIKEWADRHPAVLAEAATGRRVLDIEHARANVRDAQNELDAATAELGRVERLLE